MADKLSGKLSLQTSKKGVKLFYVVYTNAKGKQLQNPVKPGTTFPYAESEFVDGLEVEITLENGQIKKCELPGKTATVSDAQANAILAKAQQHKNQQRTAHQNSGRGSSNGASSPALHNATAPYNFITYDESRIGLLKCASDDDLYSGTIRCSLKCLSKTLVAGPSEKDSHDRRFLEIDGLPVIPGTSLKGMIRSLVEVMSFSAMDPVSDEHIFWRIVNSSETSDYKKYFNGGNSNDETIYGGYVTEVGASWYIEPVDVPARTINGEIVEVVGATPGDKSNNVNRYLFGSKRGPKKELPPSVVADFKRQMEQSKAQEKVWKARNYTQRLKKDGVPVFFCNNPDGTIFAIGLARYFRLPYELTPRDLVSPAKPDDFVKNLFGKADKENSLKGRVSFSFLQFQKNCFKYSEGPLSADLLTPHPSCLAHYLKQPSAMTNKENKKTDPSTLTSYLKKKGPELRGRKFYWHRDFDGVKTGNDNTNVSSKLYPVEPGSHGEFCVHVERVNSVELGALLCALQLEPNLAHKLGSGKALGLGSVRIEVESMDVKPLASQYSSLVGRLKQFYQSTQKCDCKENIEWHKNNFKQSVVTYLGKGVTSKDYDNLDEVQELYRILDFVNKPANISTQTMALNEKGGTTQNFAAKAILPDIMDVM